MSCTPASISYYLAQWRIDTILIVSRQHAGYITVNAKVEAYPTALHTSRLPCAAHLTIPRGHAVSISEEIPHMKTR